MSKTIYTTKDKHLMIITGDYNDADYCHTIENVEEVDIPIIRKIAKALKDKGRHNVDGELEEMYKNVLTEEEINILNEYIPKEDNCEVHTIKSIEIYSYNKKRNLL